MKGLSIMAQFGYPVIFDATHSVQCPGGLGSATGGDRFFAPLLARAALAVGVAGVFAEVHDNPDHALSDGPNMIKLKDFEQVLIEWKAIDEVSKKHPRF
jgi:2-dehydro-3-deoxyphosphooctonate aldolase (KDO 8-P synthase)